MKTWVAVVNRTEVRVFETNSADTKDMKLVKKIDNPRGRLRNRDINADKPGISTSDRFAYPTGYSKHESPVERVAHMFAIQISDFLDKSRNYHLYDRLVLVGEPRFLGKVKAALTKPTLHCLTKTLTKDLVKIPDHQLHEFIFL